MKTSETQAKILELRTLNERERKPLTSSWKNAAGMLRHHKRGLDRYIARVRNEWK